MPLHPDRHGVGRLASRRRLSLLAAAGVMTSLGVGMGSIATAANATPRA